MAPMRDQPEDYVNRLVQRNVMLADLQLVKRDGKDNDNGGTQRKGERDDDYDDHQDKQVDGSSIPTPVVTRTAWTQITNTAWTTQTATAWTTQTATTISSSVMTVVVVATPSSTSTSESSKSTSISITSAISSSPTGAVTFTIPSSEQPGRKGLCTLSNGAPCESATATTSTVTAYEAISASSAPTAQADEDGSSPSDVPPQFRNGNGHGPDGDLSPLAEKLLISAGSIGIFVIFGAIIYLVIRMKKLNRLARGEISEEEARWYGWRRNRGDPGRPPSYASGKVSQNGYPIDEKFAEREMGGFYNSDNKSSLERPGSATVNLRGLRTDLQRKNSTRSSHSGSGISASPVSGPGQSYGPPSNMDFYYSQTGTMRSQQSGQSSNAYDPSQREANHMSYLSSISSGFGDSLVMPDDSAPPQIPVSRFSWTTASQGAPNNRDTIYTTTSEETAPRFRTVNSWVAQQTGRVERKQQSDMEIPAMPEIPITYTHRSQVPDPLFAEGHQRNMSENPAFRHHPGDEIELGRGSRVPSSILDRKMGI